MLSILLALVLRGTVVYGAEKTPLPGVRVIVNAGAEKLRTTTDDSGTYSFELNASGRYNVEIRLDGFETRKRSIDVREDTTVPPIEMRLAPITEPIRGTRLACEDHEPGTVYDLPSCAERDINDRLIHQVRTADWDRAALAMLRERFLTTPTLRERIRIGGILIEVSPRRDALSQRAHALRRGRD